MAKVSNSISFKGATIDLSDMTITEESKDDLTVRSLMDVLKQWDGINGVTLTIKKDDEVCITSSGEED